MLKHEVCYDFCKADEDCSLNPECISVQKWQVWTLCIMPCQSMAILEVDVSARHWRSLSFEYFLHTLLCLWAHLHAIDALSRSIRLSWSMARPRLYQDIPELAPYWKGLSQEPSEDSCSWHLSSARTSEALSWHSFHAPSKDLPGRVLLLEFCHDTLYSAKLYTTSSCMLLSKQCELQRVMQAYAHEQTICYLRNIGFIAYRM